jgi:hypothetical protein
MSIAVGVGEGGRFAGNLPFHTVPEGRGFYRRCPGGVGLSYTFVIDMYVVCFRDMKRTLVR